ncbi:MAG: biotin/lipoyl-binding protein, partial [Lentisphaerales bacterium]
GLFHSLCYNVMFIASISTVLFNANPLLRFDGYYMLSDYLDIPNLHARSRMELTYVVERYLFGRKEARSIAGSRKESRRLVVFSILSGLYRLVVFSSIILFVADQLMVIGMVLALLFAIAWVVVPIWRFARYIAAAPQLSRCRARAIGVTCAMLLLCVGILRLVPLPSAFAAPGVLQARPCRRIYVRVPGRLQELEVQPGTQVLPGMLLAQLDSTELELELKMTREQLNEAEARKRKAMHSSKADLQSMEILVEAIRQRCDRLRDDLEKLTVVSQDSGRWVGPDLMELSGRWLDVGTELGWIVGEDGFEFVAVVSQAEASRLFNEQIRRAEIRLRGQAEHTLRVVSLHVVPMEQQALPSYSLGWRTGGDVETDLTDPSGLTAREPFFKVIATVPMSDHAAVLRHGLAGRIRFKLPPEPLLTRLGRRLFQMLQKRYRL